MEEENKEIEKNETVFQEVKPKKNVLLFVIISLIVLIGIGVLLFILLNNSDKNDNKPKENEQKEEENKEEQEENKEEKENNNEENDNNEEEHGEDYYRELEKKLKEHIDSYHTTETTNQKLVIKFINDFDLGGLYYSYGDNENVSEPSGELELLAYGYIRWNRERAAGENGINEEIYNITKKDVDEYFKQVFGIVPTKYQDIHCWHEEDKPVLYYYKDDKFVYNDAHPGHGSDLYPNFTDYYIVDYNENGNVVTIKLLLLYYGEAISYSVNGIEDDETIIDLEKIFNDEKSTDLDIIDYFHNHIDRYKKNDVFEYTFEKSANGFTLKSFKIVK